MATRQEIISGIELLIQEGRRIGAQLSEDEWARAHDFDGWKNKEMLAHIAAVGSLVVPMVGGMANAAEGANAGAGLDIDALNAQLVGARAGKATAELVEELAANYGGAIEWLRGAPDDLLTKRASFQGYENVEVGDLMMRMVVLHGLSHLYSAYSTIFEGRGA